MITVMKKYFLLTLVLILSFGCSDIGHDHDHDHGHDHGKKESPKVFSDDNEYLTNLNLMKGHLWVGFELYKSNYTENAKKHMKHPKSELYGEIVPTFEEKGLKGFAKELESLAISVENEETIAKVEENYQNLFTAINENEDFVDQESKTISKKILLVTSLLDIAAEEYAIGIVNGEVKNKFEYQDALGFTTMAKNILNSIQTENESEKQKVSSIISTVEKLSVLWPELVPTDKVEGDAKTIVAAIEEIKKI